MLRPKILVAEDDFTFRSMVATRLREEGYDVVEAADGDELGARLAEEIRPSASHHVDLALIITDIRMPGQTGLDALHALRSRWAAPPVILMTAFADAYAREQAHHLGATLLSKPFGLGSLLSCVDRLGRRASAPAVVAEREARSRREEPR